jgi:4-aminobutyrate aminotransferase-like enzyme/Ser/Thr protein kinase RdoA (MazF antagonist)
MVDAAIGFAEEVLGTRPRVAPLVGELDRNLLLAVDGRRYVLKEHRATDGLDLQDAALRHLAATPAAPLVPALVARRGPLRLLSFIDGDLFADAAPHGPALLRDLGRAVAEVDAGLTGFRHAQMDREHAWNLSDAPRHAASLDLIEDAALRELVTAVLRRFESAVAGPLAALPAQLIHNDANDRNVVVDAAAARVCGLIDFGDACLAPRVCGLAVACAYAMLGTPSPVRAVLPLVAGYHEVAPLHGAELALLDDLVRTRLAMSVCMAARQVREQPDNAYLLVSQRAVTELLPRLAAEPAGLAHLRFRDACGLDAVPSSRAVRAHLARRAGRLAPVLAPAPDGPLPVLDWSTGSPSAGEAPAGGIAIGRYCEERGVYGGEAFATDVPGERRTVHVGLDVFAPSGTQVRAPLDGVVHDVAYRGGGSDYGGVVMVRHATDGGEPFFTLYGHLSRASAEALAPGRTVAAGDAVGDLGAEHENGGWVPHLHLQLLTDDLGLGTAIDGVCAKAELSLWRSLSPSPVLVSELGRAAEALPARAPEDLVAARRVSLSRALSLSYGRPLAIVRGAGAHLYDADGRAYLDLVNNVCHVGHCHPRVVAAIAEQAARLNTNTRYLHDGIVAYARRLAAELPEPLSVVFLVNSGSEANDLALRLARAHTGRSGVLCLEHAYHGNLGSTIDISPYKFDRRGGAGRPGHVRVCAIPDPYHGGHGADGPRYAEDVAVRARELARAGVAPAAFVHESLPGCAGQVVLAPGYLEVAYAHARAAGAVCIADEVQVGLGRVGDCFSGFELQGVVPDVVTFGKPLGNGHPFGAVVTTPSIARSFANGMEYFNTFGGNPVSCAAGLAVLDVLRDEGLQAHALRVGAGFAAGLRELGSRHELVGDVRGRGLCLGVELVRDRATREPATAEAGAVANMARDEGVLLSMDGPFDNVLKIKPPLVLAADDAARAVEVLDGALRAVACAKR